ncbi:retinol dehydrogenase 7-like [Rhinophrynus dorsalis]
MWFLFLVVVALIFLYRWNRQRQILQNLSDKYVLITGCDSGFGKLAAKQLDRCGLQVLAACLTEGGAEDLKKETSSRVQTVILDVTDSQSVSSVAEWTAHIVGDVGLWGLVNNAGIASPVAPNEWLKKEDFMTVFNVNLLGVIDVTVQLLPLIRRARGRIVNVASVLGRMSVLGGGYCISKYGVEAFSDSLRRELGGFGVKVSIIEPGYFKTPITGINLYKNAMEKKWNNLSSEIKQSYGEQYLKQSIQRLQDFLNTCSPQISKVTDCMEHALTACQPWTRYSAGWDAKLFYIPFSYLPTFISDYVFTRSVPKPACKVE